MQIEYASQNFYLAISSLPAGFWQVNKKPPCTIAGWYSLQDLFWLRKFLKVFI